MDKICYKVVTTNAVFTNSYLSTSTNILNVYSLTYQIGKTTYPRIGKIFVFNTLKNAENFLGNEGVSILKGIAKNISFPKYCCCRLNIERFWKLKKQKKKVSFFSNSVITGTVWCDSFTPTELVN